MRGVVVQALTKKGEVYITKIINDFFEKQQDDFIFTKDLTLSVKSEVE
jgi:hypothetical protein